MSVRQYLKNQLPVVVINLLGILALSLFLTACGNSLSTILFIAAVWLLVLAFCLLAFCLSRRKHLNRLLDMTEQLEERYLLPEIMKTPERAEEQVFYQILKMAEKSMLERIGRTERERREYKEYIEKGFTGQNGRAVHSATGIGLYLCRRLCDKLGIGISVSSEGAGTTVSLSFYINDFVNGARG